MIATSFASTVIYPDIARIIECVLVWGHYEIPFRFFGKLIEGKQI